MDSTTEKAPKNCLQCGRRLGRSYDKDMCESCIYDIDDHPHVVTLRDVTRTARRGRKCSCGKRIPPGTQYKDISGTCNGELFQEVFCLGSCPHGGQP